ncbi:P-loop containing nucleoside triphosphate hydrolase protein [Armillaria nabsnona]|nr:P-loop containing nucleoside triphosphate hydrolase protein [Armillaria nabsnona]
MAEAETESTTTFESLGLSKPLLDAVKKLGYKQPTPIQQQCIPPALEGRDIIGLAPTGSGKTAAFAIPILQKLWDAPQGLFACVLSPTHELAHQIATQFEALGAGMGVRCAVIVSGDMDRVAQAVALAKRPHILVATPGRIADHLWNTKGFSLHTLKFLVLDEADRLLDLDFGTHLDDVLKAVPKQRTTYLFSATMTTKVSKLQRASLTSPVRIETSSSHHTVPTLLQYYLLSNSMIVFVRTVHDAQRISIILRTLSFNVVPLHGDLTRSQRMGALAKFRSGDTKILVATDVASRLQVVWIFHSWILSSTSTYQDILSRVGRTARAGRAGKAIMIITQYDVELLQRLECLLEKKLEEWPTDKEDVLAMHPTVDEAGRVAANELREAGKQQKSRKRKRQAGETDDQGIEEVSLLRGAPRH